MCCVQFQENEKIYFSQIPSEHDLKEIRVDEEFLCRLKPFKPEESDHSVFSELIPPEGMNRKRFF